MKEKILMGVIVVFGIIIVVLSVLLYKSNVSGENDSKTTNTYSDEVIVVTNNSTNTYVSNEVQNVTNNNIVEVPGSDFEEATSDDDYQIEIQEDTISESGATIIITNLSGHQFSCGVEFYVQEKVDNEWEYLETEEGSSWISIAYLSDENCQFKQNINWTDYYGELSSGIYRIVKPIFVSEGMVNFYTDEFEIE